MKHFIDNGRYGDIIHVLPAIREYVQRTGERVRMTVAEEFATVLEGCSYIEGHAAPCPWQKVQDILGYARSRFPMDNFQVVACYGHEYSCGYQTWSFLRESWRLTECPAPPETQPLVFDRRNPQRELELYRSLRINPNKPFILACVSGKSSPFPQGAQLLQDVLNARPDCQLVDISTLRADRVYDLLGLFEKAEALVTIDTMHLHLSAAVPTLRVFAFICNGPTKWNRTDWRPQQVWRCTYLEYTDRRAEFRLSLGVAKRSVPTIHHITTRGLTDSDNSLRRRKVAQASWTTEAEWAGNWVIEEVLETNARRVFRPDGNLVFVKDLIDQAAEQCSNPTDIISLSNCDVGCVHGITGQVMDTVREFGSAFTHRYDWTGSDLAHPVLSEAKVAGLNWYPGSDWFFMSKAWWTKHRDEMPDMLVGREFWDAVLRQLMKKYNTREITAAVWHEKHESMWDRPGLRQNLAGNRHNGELATAWFRANQSDANDPFRSTWNIQPGVTVPVNTPKSNNLIPTKKPGPNLVYPTRLKFQPNLIRVNPR